MLKSMNSKLNSFETSYFSSRNHKKNEQNNKTTPFFQIEIRIKNKVLFFLEPLSIKLFPLSFIIIIGNAI